MPREITSKQARLDQEAKDAAKHDLNYPKREDKVIEQNLKTHRPNQNETRGHSNKSK